ncbi:MAG: glycoside hydrolase family 28 protein, partial [Calditrichaeota bacterium]|nr:glycoside hydrolase family 28 protein [Calditrichota bacterium]
YMRNVTVGEVSDAVIRIIFYKKQGQARYTLLLFTDLYVCNVASRKSRYAIYLAGYERSPVANFNLDNCRFDGVQDGNMLRHYTDLNMQDVYINGQLQN